MVSFHYKQFEYSKAIRVLAYYILTFLIPSSTTTPKVLVISIKEQASRMNFKSLFAYWFSNFKFHFNAMRIAIDKSKKSIFGVNKISCDVHQYNPYVKRFTKNVCRRGVQWFSGQTKNFHRSVFKIGLYTSKRIAIISI